MTTPPTPQTDPLAVAVGLAYAATRTAAQVVADLVPMGTIPTSERQARELAFTRAILEDRP